MKQRNPTAFFLSFCILVVIGNLGVTQGQLSPSGSTEVSQEQESKPVEAGTYQDTSQIIEYLEFRSMDIKDVLRQLSKQYNLNIVFSESVGGPVTVQLHHITLEEALDSIITVNGFAYTRKENVIKVTTPDESEREGKFTKLFRLNNADASSVKESVQKILTSEGTVEADVRSNSLIVTDIPSVVNKAEKMIHELDKMTYQVLIEARFIETSLTKSEEMGIDWSMGIKAQGASRPTTFPFKAWESKQDYYPEQSYTVNSGIVTSDFPFRGESLQYPNEPFRLGAFPTVSSSDFSFGILDFSQLVGIMDFIKIRQDSKLIATPRITTLNNHKATIHVGRNVPIPTFERNTETGRWEITGYSEEVKVGVFLEVTPQVSHNGHIRLKIKPEVSNIVDWLTIEGDRVRPITSTRTAETEVLIRDNQTVVIGGLLKDKNSLKKKKIPILGDLPLLSSFFTRYEESSEAEPSEKTDLLIFVTARIVSGDNQQLVAYRSNLISAPLKPFKLNLRKVARE